MAILSFEDSIEYYVTLRFCSKIFKDNEMTAKKVNENNVEFISNLFNEHPHNLIKKLNFNWI